MAEMTDAYDWGGRVLLDRRMEIPEKKVLEPLRDRGNHDEAEAADGEWPDAVDTDRDAGLLTKFGVHPPELLAGL